MAMKPKLKKSTKKKKTQQSIAAIERKRKRGRSEGGKGTNGVDKSLLKKVCGGKTREWIKGKETDGDEGEGKGNSRE